MSSRETALVPLARQWARIEQDIFNDRFRPQAKPDGAKFEFETDPQMHPMRAVVEAITFNYMKALGKTVCGGVVALEFVVDPQGYKVKARLEGIVFDEPADLPKTEAGDIQPA